MKHVFLFALVSLAPAVAWAQTSYPMLMSLDPVAAQVGQSSEHEVSSRYNMFGADKVLVTGDGVTGEVVSPMKKSGDKTPNLTKIKVKFTVADDAMPGVRDFRLATPQGVTTLGQLVIVRDPVAVESSKNDTSGQAQEITVPATVCGRIERAEDVDFYKFKVEAGTSRNFHVRCMRLQNRIHDLQQHADPIISIRNASGTTLAQSDNDFAGDPLLGYYFEQAGEYFLEIRDVRYQGNGNWQYSIEISDRPFLQTAFPLGVPRGQQTKLQLVGLQLPDDPTASVEVPADAPSGPQPFSLPLAGGPANPVNLVVTDLPPVVESDADNDSPDMAQAVSVPAAISGRIETEADVDCYSFAATKEERFSFEVIARRQQSDLDSTVRILNADGKSLANNDDSKLNRYTSADSWIENWSAPADGQYTLEIRDLHLRGGPAFVYLLNVTRAEPYFELYLDSDKTQLEPGTSGVIFARAFFKNGFAGDVQLDIDGLPPGVTASCGRILAGSKTKDGCIILTAANDAQPAVSNVTVTGTAVHELNDNEKLELSAVAVPQQETYMPGGGRNHWQVDMHTVSVGAPSDLRAVKVSTHEVTLKPGESQKIDVEIDRAEGFNKNVTLDLLFRHLNSTYANTLPPGVSIDAKNSKTLLTGETSKGHITLKAGPKAKPVAKQQTSVMANISINFVMKATYSSQPLWITVAEP